MIRARAVRALVAGLALAQAGAAAAQPQPGAVPAAPPPARTRLFGGLGAGVGLMGLACGPSCEGMDGAAGLSGHAGLLLGSGLVVLYDASLLVHLDDSALSPVRVYYSTHLLSLQGWLAPRVWVRGGPGLGHLRVNHVGIGVRSEMAPTLGGALGVEVARADPVVFEGILRVSAGFFDEDDGQDDAVYTLSVGAGASWY